MGLIADRVCGDHAEGTLDALNIRDLLYGASRDELIRDDVMGNGYLQLNLYPSRLFVPTLVQTAQIEVRQEGGML
ncbi:hypothetical protein PSH81_12820 [Pseudomonas sp. FP2335]|jgi:hypothetical protein|uniref:hypothetical protein n=1 Tax=Pseudomonas sp. FP2335 TaxID=2954092 RepID=UPI0027325CA2|nr:hypothetical protein [Pseudomonas sp. FP2335]WLH81790.1 hypothetical protein PSH81_12820 [Pseudomonas sp. FP2335]